MTWTDEEDRTHHRTEVVGESFLILTPKDRSGEAEASVEDSVE